MGDEGPRDDSAADDAAGEGADPGVETQARAAAEELRSALVAQARGRAIRLARASRLTFALGIASLVLLVLVWVLGAVGTSEAGFRLAALATVVLFGLAFLTGALSAAATRRSQPAPEPNSEEPGQPKKVRPTS